MIRITLCTAAWTAAMFLVTCSRSYGQAGLRDALEKLDRNENGVLEPDEVTPLARPYIERVMKSRRRGLERPIRIEDIQDAARVHYAIQNGVAGKNVQPKPENNVKAFGPEWEGKMLPGFGLGRIKYPYTRADLQEADDTIRRYDYNRDGQISRNEALRSRWTHRNPFDDDINKDDKLSKMELTQRYARRRLLEGDVKELIRKARRVGNGIKSARKERTDESNWWRKGGSDFWLTASLMSRFDANRNGRLEVAETRSLGLPAAKIDLDGDGEVQRDELFKLVKLMQDQAGDMAQGLPGWFYEMDSNRDQQVALSEFADVSSRLDEFRLLDSNSDGLLTAKEASQAESLAGGKYRNDQAEVLPSRRTIISEIEIEDDFLIGDVDVQISITHTHVGFIDAFVTSPDGQRVELFTAVGGGGDHFERTIFDDESPIPITKAKPPYKGRFRTKGPERKQPGLSAFDDKSVKGVWQLVVRGTRSDRFGMLHSWNLRVTPKDAVPERTKQDEDETKAADEEDKTENEGDKKQAPKKKMMGQTANNQTTRKPPNAKNSPGKKRNAKKPTARCATKRRSRTSSGPGAMLLLP